MKNPIREVASGLYSLFSGMRITMGQFFKPNVTLQYPHQSVKMTPRFRGHIELVRDPVTGKALCFACKNCQRACPSDCIIVDGAKLEGDKRKSVSQFQLDFTKCSLCGSCVEACKGGAIRFGRDYNLAGVSKEEFIMDLFKKLQSESFTPTPPLAGLTPQVTAPAPLAPLTSTPAAMPAAATAPAPVQPEVPKA